ncbi:MAG: lipid A-modifier LpxR family protein, partial [Pseudomonadota bacterium]
QTPAGASYALVGGGDRATPSISLNGTLRTDPIESTAWSASPVLRIVNGQLNAQRVSGPRYARETVGGEVSFSAPSEFTGLNFDIGLVPRATIATEGDFSVRRIGAEFRFGQDIDQRGTLVGLPSWYLFAGADGEAVIFNNSTADGLGLGLVNGLQLRDQVTVGDMQAGVSLHKYGTNFTFSYIRREVDYRMGDERFDLNEDFGGITLSWRR